MSPVGFRVQSMFESMLKQDTEYHLENSAPGLCTRLNSDPSQLQRFLTSFIDQHMSNIVELITCE